MLFLVGGDAGPAEGEPAAETLAFGVGLPGIVTVVPGAGALGAGVADVSQGGRREFEPAAEFSVMSGCMAHAWLVSQIWRLLISLGR
jgi:hypothetical protein